MVQMIHNSGDQLLVIGVDFFAVFAVLQKGFSDIIQRGKRREKYLRVNWRMVR